MQLSWLILRGGRGGGDWGEGKVRAPSRRKRGGPAKGDQATIPDPEFLDDLNPKQREAATYTGGPLLILAGAGSGKTRCLTYRFAYLVDRFDLHPGRILAITFTNKAAREMRERIERLLGGRRSTGELFGGGPSGAGGVTRPGSGARGRAGGPADGLWVSTFHSACARLLRRYGPKVGLDRNFVIYDEDDQRAVMKEVVAGLGWDENRWPPAGLLAAVSRAKDQLIGPAEMARSARDFGQERAARAYALYQQRLAANNAVDFDDLIFRTVVLLRENSDVLDALREHFRHVLIDEYQDTNHAQYVFADLLAAEHRNLCVVGDDDQSIYAWRGADIRNVLEFEEDYPDAKVIRLEQNYRSTKTVLAAANAVIAHNERRKGKELWTENEAGDPVVYYLAEDEREEAEFVAGEVVGGQRHRGHPYRSFAVLYRTHAQSRAFEEVFVRRAIPYQIIGGVRFYERKEIKDVLAYLRVVHNPADEVALERALGAPKRGIGPGTLSKLQGVAAGAGGATGGAAARAGTGAAAAGAGTGAARLAPPGAVGGLYAALRAVAGGEAEVPGLGSKALGEIRRFVDLVDGLRARAETMSVTDMVREVAEKSGMIEALRREGTEEANSRLENIQELASVAADYARQADAPSLASFLENAALLADIDVMKEGDDGVVLMTMHNAKGLEFPNVFVVGLEQGLFPHARSFEEAGGVEEERRLFYVAMTRAMRRLYLTHARSRTVYGYPMPAEASMFLEEVPAKTLFVASLIADRRVAGAEGAGVARGARGFDGPGDEGAGGERMANERMGDGAATGARKRARRNPPEDDLAAARDGRSPATRAGPRGAAARFQPGEKVTHPKWGRGVIVGMERVGVRPGNVGELQLRVAFDGQGIKTFPASEAERG